MLFRSAIYALSSFVALARERGERDTTGYEPFDLVLLMIYPGLLD